MLTEPRPVLENTKAVARRCSVKKVFLEISQNSQENTCARDFLNKSCRPATLLQKSLRHRCFLVNFAKFLGTPFFTEHLRASVSENKEKQFILFNALLMKTMLSIKVLSQKSLEMSFLENRS